VGADSSEQGMVEEQLRNAAGMFQVYTWEDSYCFCYFGLEACPHLA